MKDPYEVLGIQRGELKLTANVTEQYDDKVEAGQVISASQEAGAQLKWGDSVDVVISKGPEMATIPSGLVGKQESAVTKTLEGSRFRGENRQGARWPVRHGTYREKRRYGSIQRRQDSPARRQRQPHRHHPRHRVRVFTLGSLSSSDGEPTHVNYISASSAACWALSSALTFWAYSFTNS